MHEQGVESVVFENGWHPNTNRTGGKEGADGRMMDGQQDANYRKTEKGRSSLYYLKLLHRASKQAVPTPQRDVKREAKERSKSVQ